MWFSWEQDKQIAKLQHDQDKIFAEDKMCDELFVKYMNDITQLLKENNC
jgi:hypothetical protein